MKRIKTFQQTADKREQQLIGAVISIMILRFLFIFIMGPMPQDAYYFFYSQHPALSYFDHPPDDRLPVKSVHYCIR